MGRKEPKPHDWREWRRFRAWDLTRQGWCERAVAEALDVSIRSVSQGTRRASRDGPDALLARPRPGCPPRLTADQKRLIPDFLWHGPEAYGFHGAYWTGERVARVIEEEFGVAYHPGHVARILKQLNWTPQIPITRAVQRDEEEIQRWPREVWPELGRRALRERRRLIFVDESGFYLLPAVAKTYAPRGVTPVLHEWQTRDHLSVMGGITPEGRFYTLARQHSLNGLHTVAFLIHLLRYASRWLVVWDWSPIHRRAAVKDYVASLPGRSIHVDFLPRYAPDLNPVEFAWGHLKETDLRNVISRDLEELHENFHLAVGRIRHRPHLLQSFFAAAGLSLDLRTRRAS
jgi:transposase